MHGESTNSAPDEPQQASRIRRLVKHHGLGHLVRRRNSVGRGPHSIARAAGRGLSLCQGMCAGSFGILERSESSKQCRVLVYRLQHFLRELKGYLHLLRAHSIVGSRFDVRRVVAEKT